MLAELKQDPALLMLPVVMLTSSRAEQDILRSYALHANAYVSKPVDFEHFIEAIRQIDDFFLTLVRLPHTTAPTRDDPRHPGSVNPGTTPDHRKLARHAADVRVS